MARVHPKRPSKAKILNLLLPPAVWVLDTGPKLDSAGCCWEMGDGSDGLVPWDLGRAGTKVAGSLKSGKVN